jgi:hypothetical protein
MFLLLALILDMGHDQHDILKQYWSRKPMCHAPFYPSVMKRNRFLHILQFVHFENEMLPTGTKTVMTDFGN